MGRPSTSLETSCKTCGKIFSSAPSHKRKFCSRVCFAKRNKNLSLNAKCGYCKKKFHVKPSKLKYGKGKFCSFECYRKSQINRIELICQECNKPFLVFPSKVKTGRKYCSYKCAQIAHRGEGNGKWVASVKLICEFCEKVFYMKPWEAGVGKGRRFCSSACRYRELRGEKHCNWCGGISWEPYGMGFNKVLKETIRCRDNHACQIGSCNKKQNGRKFPVHHIDYNKKNNNPENLITLCNFHHTKTNFNRNYWKEYFEVS